MEIQQLQTKMQRIIMSFTIINWKRFLEIQSMEMMVILLRYGWMVPKEVALMHRNTTLKNGLRQFRITREKQRDMMQTVCYLGQKHIPQYAGLEMNWELQERIRGQNLK